VGLKLNGAHCLVVYVNDVNLLAYNINILTLIDTSNEVGLEVNAEKNMCILMSHHQNAGQNHDIKIANRCFENVAQSKYLGMTPT
jgi:hypothetical protein